MAEERKESWREAPRARPGQPQEDPEAIPVKTIPTRETMSFIRALANDWEDERSRLTEPR